jgi:hypothetical protein
MHQPRNGAHIPLPVDCPLAHAVLSPQLDALTQLGKKKLIVWRPVWRETYIKQDIITELTMPLARPNRLSELECGIARRARPHERFHKFYPCEYIRYLCGT